MSCFHSFAVIMCTHSPSLSLSLSLPLHLPQREKQEKKVCLPFRFTYLHTFHFFS
jgi:hypothetical protein